MFCVSCIQLEKHSCPKLAERVANEKSVLQKNLIKVVGQKVIPI